MRDFRFCGGFHAFPVKAGFPLSDRLRAVQALKIKQVAAPLPSGAICK